MLFCPDDAVAYDDSLPSNVHLAASLLERTLPHTTFLSAQGRIEPALLKPTSKPVSPKDLGRGSEKRPTEKQLA